MKNLFVVATAITLIYATEAYETEDASISFGGGYSGNISKYKAYHGSPRIKRQIPFGFKYEDSEFKNYLEIEHSLKQQLAKNIAKDINKKKKILRSVREPLFSRSENSPQDNNEDLDNMFEFMNERNSKSEPLISSDSENKANIITENDEDLKLIPLKVIVANIAESSLAALRPVAYLAANIIMKEINKRANTKKAKRNNYSNIQGLLEKLEKNFNDNLEKDLQEVIANSFINNYSNDDNNVANTIDDRLANNVYLKKAKVLSPVSTKMSTQHRHLITTFWALIIKPLKSIFGFVKQTAVSVAKKAFKIIDFVFPATKTARVVEDKILDYISNDLFPKACCYAPFEKENNDVNNVNVLLSFITKSLREKVGVLGEKSVDTMSEIIIVEVLKNNLKETILEVVKEATMKGIKASDNSWNVDDELDSSKLEKAKPYLMKEMSNASEKVALAIAETILKTINEAKLQNNIDELIKKTSDLARVKKRRSDEKENEQLVSWLSISCAHYIIDSAKAVKERLSSKNSESNPKKDLNKEVSQMIEKGITETIENIVETEASKWFFKNMVQIVTNSSIKMYINEINREIEEGLTAIVSKADAESIDASKDSNEPMFTKVIDKDKNNIKDEPISNANSIGDDDVLWDMKNTEILTP